jgi:hypothetical protein
MSPSHTQQHPRAPLRFEADLDQESTLAFPGICNQALGNTPHWRFNKISFYINQMNVFFNFASQLFRTLDLMRYLISKSSPQGEA